MNIKFLYKCLIILINKSSIMVGGQAVIEGVMMRVPGSYATAIRDSKGNIQTEFHHFTSLVERYNIKHIPIVRGFIHLIESMKIGYRTLDWSSKFVEENESNNKYIEIALTFFSIIFAFALFMGIPYFLTEYILQFQLESNNNIIFNVLAGCVRIVVFLIYLVAISKLSDVKRLFAYHGAEHKVVYNFESGNKINVNNAKKFSTKHPRCGTSFVFILMLVTICTYSILDSAIAKIFLIEFNIMTRLLFHILCLPLVIGFGYEVLKFLAKHQANYFIGILSLPGLWLQSITTNEPDEEQLEVSILALQTAFNDTLDQFQGQQFNADAI